MPNAALRSMYFVSLLLLTPFSQIFAISDTDNDDPSSYTADGRPIYTVPRIASEICVDGVLDEEAWENALTLELNYETYPGENIPPPVRTEVLLVYDESHLYVAYRCYDPDPSSIRAHLTDRDPAWSDDYMCIILDTFNDERRAFEFVANPLGVQGDLIYDDISGDEDDSWDTIWDSAGRIFDWGYAGEMAIPFSSLRFQRADGNQIWGFDVGRSYPRSDNHIIELTAKDRSINSRTAQYVKIEGFDGATPGRNIEVIPTVTAVRTDERSELPDGDFETSHREAEAGLTVRWGITPNMTLSATANPDFSQVEADALQLDINQPFALYYPERRSFFTEGSEQFNMEHTAVYTRTMRDPSWGFKLTGKEGANTVCAYVVRDELTNLIFPGSQSSDATSLAKSNTSSVFRYLRDIGNRYTFGVLATDREGKDYYNRLIGFDGNFRITDTDRIYMQFLGSSTRYPDDTAAEFSQPNGNFTGYSRNLQYTHSTRTFGWWLEYSEVGSGLRTDLGFMPRVGYRYWGASLNHTWNPEPGSWFSWMYVSGNYGHMEDRNGDLLYRSVSLQFSFQGPLQSGLNSVLYSRREKFSGVEFDQTLLQFNFGIWPTGNIYLFFACDFGNDIDYANTRPGNRMLLNPSVTYNLGRHLRINLNHVFEQLNIEEGRLYTANISGLTTIYQFNTRAFLRSIFQYTDYRYAAHLYSSEIDPIYRRFFTQLLFSYKINPRTVLFVGYSGNHFGSQDYGLAQADRTFFVKLGYSWVL